jgi:XTP/dITP diphosphohydrolase
MDPRLKAFERLLNIMDELREKCPWDQKQTFESLRSLTIEETYELAEAISINDLNEVKKELGDLFLHLVFYAKLGEEGNHFTLEDTLNGICEKLIVRHPHIYGDVKVNNEEDVKSNWEKIKMKEGRKSVLEGVPKALPALIKAARIQEKVRGIGFDWEHKEQVWEKVNEELLEFKEAQAISQEEATKEFGDVLFSLVNYARFVDINPENALELTNKKFIKRFQCMEEKIQSENKSMDNMTLPELDTYWNQAKKFD